MKWVIILLSATAVAFADEDAHHTRLLRTRFTFRRPTSVNVLGILVGDNGEIFDDTDDSSIHQLLPKEIKFNHNSVGITHPIRSSHDISFPLCSGYASDNEDNLCSIFIDRLGRSSRNTSNNIVCNCINNYKGWRILQFHKRVGSGKECYRQLQNAIHNWNFESCKEEGRKSVGILAPNKSVRLAASPFTSTIIPRRGLLATFSKLPFINSYVVNPIHVIYDITDDSKVIPNCLVSSSSYATLQGHLLAGEERVSVILRDNNDVDVEVVSFSRSAPSLNGRIVWPFIGSMQRQFFLKEMEHLMRVAKCKR
jgi:uncharacterized protein (UPF0548 family)